MSSIKRRTRPTRALAKSNASTLNRSASRPVARPTAPRPITQLPKPFHDYVMAHIDYSSGGRCWLYTGRLTADGYGVIRVPLGGRWVWVSVHKYLYVLRRGPVAAGLQLDHLCRVRRCCKPSHLQPVTRKVNLMRRIFLK